MKISIIVAVAKNNVIGKKGSWLLWHIPEDLKHFKEITMGHHILMGRKTFESIGRVLPGRVSLILSSNKNYKVEGTHIFQKPEEAIEFAKKYKEKELFIIGGGEIYKALFPLAQKLYVTRVLKSYKGDVYFPKIDEGHWNKKVTETHLESKIPYEFVEYTKQ